MLGQGRREIIKKWDNFYMLNFTVTVFMMLVNGKIDSLLKNTSLGQCCIWNPFTTEIQERSS